MTTTGIWQKIRGQAAIAGAGLGWLLFLGALSILFQSAISWILIQVDSPWEILKHQLSTDLDSFLVTRDNWGPEKSRIFLQHYWLDFLYPAVYAVFLRCLLTRIQAIHPTKFVYHSLAFPFAAAIYDYIENICQMALIAGWTESRIVFYLGAVSAYCKLLLIGAVISAAMMALWIKFSESRQGN